MSPQIKFNISRFNKNNFEIYNKDPTNIRKLAFVDNSSQENNIKLSKINISQPSNYNTSKVINENDSDFSS